MREPPAAGQMLAQLAVSKSRLADRGVLEVGINSIRSLARAEVTESEARPWRVTLGRCDRADQQALNSGAGIHGVLFTSQNYSYSAGRIVGAPTPPMRANPIGVGPGGSDVDPWRVEIAWGMGEGGAQRMIAHWPVQGASLTVHGSYVEVFGSGFMGYAAGSIADLPLLNASIVPSQVGDGADHAGELSIQQDENLDLATNNVVVYVPEYARSVKVSGPLGPNNIPFATGQPRLMFQWFDSLGFQCAADSQGSSIGVPADFVAVPARAVLLRLTSPGPNLDCNEEVWTSGIMLVHWRLAP